MNKVKYKNKKEWLENRKNGIGGSDASAIIGMNPYKTNVELWKIKTGKIEQEDISDNKYVRYGTLAEEYIRELFKLDYEDKYYVKYEENTMLIDDEYDFLYASLDGVIEEIGTKRKGILEIKTVNVNGSTRLKWNNRIPDNYYIQILHYLMITKFEFAIIVAQFKTEYEGELLKRVKHYIINRSDVEKDIEYLREKELEFWKENVKKNKEPNLIINI